ncbi:MAG TPA: DinB family protein [Acidobacteriaceae bacterium]|nr:DinB family protein [Acidobacteriaceae bacterium]
MTIAELFLEEFDLEMPGTRKLLERVPDDRFAWKPHEKSMTLGRLSSHIADLPARCSTIITTEELVRQPGFTPWAAASTVDLLDHFDSAATQARAALTGLREDQLSATWTIKMGDRTLASMPRVMALRRVFLDHIIHHRAQLGVFLRLLDIPIPGVYGASADDQR